MSSTNSGPSVTTTPNYVSQSAPAGSAAVPFDPSSVAVTGGTIGKVSVGKVANILRQNRLINRFDGRLAQSALNGYTWHTQYSPGAAFMAVRLVIANAEAVTVPINKAIVAVTAIASPSSVLVPSVGNTRTDDPTTGWCNVTFSGSATATVPAAIGTNNPSFLVSDWIALPSIPCTDITGQPPVAMARVYVDPAATTYSIGSNSLVSWSNAFEYPNFPAGRFLRVTKQTGDFVTTPSGMTSTTLETSVGILAGMEFLTPGGAATIMGCGDSITAGSSANYLNGWGLRTATTLSALQSVPVAYFNNGWGGQTSLQYYNRAVTTLGYFRPDVLVYAPFSPNDGTGTYTQAFLTAARNQMVRMMELCQRNGVALVLTTGIPYYADATNDARRITLNNEIRAMASSGIFVADFDLAISNGATPARMPSALQSGDDTHPNDAGHDLLSSVLVPIVRSALNI